MRMPAKMLRAVKAALGDQLHSHPPVWYVPIDTPVMIGGVIHETPGAPSLPAPMVKVHRLGRKPVRSSVTLEQCPDDPCLYFITITQDAGGLWYRWSKPDGTQSDFVAFADNEPDTETTRTETRAWTNRQLIVWQVVARTGMDESVARQVCTRVENNAAWATKAHAFGVYLRHFLEGRYDTARGIAMLLERPRNLTVAKETLADAGIHYASEEECLAILRATWTSLH